MASINDFGGASPDTLLDPPLGGPSGWAAAVAAALNGSDTTVDARITAAIAAHAAAADPHPTYSTAAEVASAIAAHAAAADPHSIYMTVAEHAALDHTGIPGVGSGGGGVGPRIWYQPAPPVDPGDGDVWIDSDSDEPLGGGGGASAYADLTDVDVTSVADGDVPVWDAGLGKWVPAAPSGGSGGGGALRPVAAGDVSAAGGISLPASAFTTASRRYLLQLSITPSADCEMRIRERAAGADDTGAEYGHRNTVAGNDAGMGAYPTPGYTDTSIGIGWGLDGGRKATWDVWIDGPAHAENTTFWWMSVIPYWVGATSVINGWGSAEHRDPTAYDSLTVYPSTGDITGHWALFAYDETVPTPIVGQSRLWTPESEHPQNDEFRDGAIGAEWIHVDAATAGNVTWTEGGDCLSILLNGGDDAGPALHGLMKPYALAVGEYIQMHIRHMGWQYNFPAVGLCIADGATAGAGNQIISMGIRSGGFTGVSQALFTGYNSRVAGYLDVADDRIWPSFHMRILRYASDVWRFFLSADGVEWVAMNTAYTRTYAMTPTHIGIITTNWGGGAVAGAQFSIDYFRVGS